jgi:hypothetical protein
LAWAQNDAAVAERVAPIEVARTGNAERLLGEIGFPPSEAAAWADIGYTTVVGMMSRTTRDPASVGGRGPTTSHAWSTPRDASWSIRTPGPRETKTEARDGYRGPRRQSVTRLAGREWAEVPTLHSEQPQGRATAEPVTSVGVQVGG